MIGERKGAAVFRKVQADRAGDFGESAVAIVREHHISLVAVPGAIRANQFIERLPSALVSRRGRGVVGRFAHHLPPEEACEIAAVRRGDIAVGDIEIGVAIMIEVPEVGAPGPAAHLDSGLLADIFESARRPGCGRANCRGRAPVERANLFGAFSWKSFCAETR